MHHGLDGVLPQRAPQHLIVEQVALDEGRAARHGGVVAPREVIVDDDIVPVAQ